MFVSLVPERPSLENRELSPVPDIVSPTSPILQSSHNQNTYSEPRNIGPTRNGEVTGPECCDLYTDLFSESLSPRTVESSSLERRGAGDVAGVHSSSLQRRRSRIPTAHARPSAAARSARSGVQESELGTESVDERLETLLHLLGGARPGSVANR